MKKNELIHPFLFGIYPILFLFSHNADEVFFADTYFSFLVTIAGTAIVVLLFWLVFKNSAKTGIAASVSILLFTLYWLFLKTLSKVKIGPIDLGNHPSVLIISGLILVSVLYGLKKRKGELTKISNLFNIIGITLIVMVLYEFGMYEWKHSVKWSVEDITGEDIKITPGIKNDDKPDIYYIILDGYANHQTLKTTYNYDNSDLLNFLEQNKFKVIPKSRTNHSITFLSLSSSLNMMYDTVLTPKIGKNSLDRKLTYLMIKNNKVTKFLTDIGYNYVHVSSGWGPTNENVLANKNIQFTRINNFEMMMIQLSMLNPFAKYIIGEVMINRALKTFEILGDEVPKMEGPKFVFAHLLIPHPPFLFKANGEKTPWRDVDLRTSQWDDKDDYLEQLKFTNFKVKTMVEKILANSKKDPVIIIQSDHGPGHTFENYDTTGGWENPSLTNLNEKMRIIHAIHLPDNSNKILYDSITPVNSFRTIFNHYFKTQLPILGDDSYYSNPGKPYDFIPVTDKVRFD